jgi:hypothetical protein
LNVVVEERRGEEDEVLFGRGNGGNGGNGGDGGDGAGGLVAIVFWSLTALSSLGTRLEEEAGSSYHLPNR